MSQLLARFNDYDFRHWVAVQAEAGYGETVHRLFSHLDDNGRNSWFAAREQRNELSGYVTDLGIAHTLADTAAVSRSRCCADGVALQLRYALVSALLRDLAERQQPELTARYVQAGIWNPDQALAWAQLNPDPQSALKTVVEALRRGGEERRDELTRLALAFGAKIRDADNRVQAIAALTDDIPRYYLNETLDMVGREDNEGSRLGALNSLVPKLPDDLKLEALRIAEQFKDKRLHAEAIAVVAAQLKEPERTKAFEKFIAQAQIALSEPNGDLYLDGFGKTLPKEWFGRLGKIVDAERNFQTFEAFNTILFQRLAERKPQFVREQVRDLRSWRRSDILVSVAAAFSAQGSHRDASDVAAEVSTESWNRNVETLVTILRETPESEWPRWSTFIWKLWENTRIDVLRRLAGSEAPPTLLLRQIVQTIDDGDQRLQAYAAISRVLTGDEREEIFEKCLGMSKALQFQVLEDLAALLPIGHVKRALDKIQNSMGLNNEPLKLLLTRLADLGEPDEAIRRAAESNIPEFRRAEILAALSSHLPDDKLSRLRAATRPGSVGLPRARARCTLFAWLPPERIQEIIAEAFRLTNPLDRVQILSEMVDDFPVRSLADVTRQLLASIPRVLESPSLSRKQILHTAFRALSRSLTRSPSSEHTKLAITFARRKELSAEDQLRLLTAFSTAGRDKRHVYDSLAAALKLAAKNPRLISMLAAQLSEKHSKVVGRLLIARTDSRWLAVVLEAAGRFLDGTAKKTAVKRVEAIHDTLWRHVCLLNLLPLLSHEQRFKCATAELNRTSEWPGDPEHFLSAVCMLAPHSHRAARRHFERVRQVFTNLEPYSKPFFAGPLADAMRFSREIIEQAFEAVSQIQRDKRPAAFRQLTPWLNVSQIARALSSIRDLGMVPDTHVLAAFVRRAAALKDPRLLLQCLSLPERGSSNSPLADDARLGLIKEVASDLPLEVLSSTAAVVGHQSDQILGALALRATKLGHMRLTLSFLKRMGKSRYSGDQTLDQIYKLAPSAWAKQLVRFAESELFEYERAHLLVQLLDRIPRWRRRELIKLIARNRMAMADIDVLRALKRELIRLPRSLVVSMWTSAMRESSAEGRDKVLVAITGWAPVLVHHFGSSIAQRLDDAIILGACDRWP